MLAMQHVDLYDSFSLQLISGSPLHYINTQQSQHTQYNY